MGKKLGSFIEQSMKERESKLIASGSVKKGRKLSRNYMAKEVLNVSGTWFSSVINGESEPSDELLIKIANFLEIDERVMFLMAERVHPDDYEKFKVKYLNELAKEVEGSNNNYCN